MYFALTCMQVYACHMHICMYVCIHTYIYTHTHTHVYIMSLTHTYTHAYMHTYRVHLHSFHALWGWHRARRTIIRVGSIHVVDALCMYVCMYVCARRTIIRVGSMHVVGSLCMCVSMCELYFIYLNYFLLQKTFLCHSHAYEKPELCSAKEAFLCQSHPKVDIQLNIHTYTHKSTHAYIHTWIIFCKRGFPVPVTSKDWW